MATSCHNWLPCESHSRLQSRALVCAPTQCRWHAKVRNHGKAGRHCRMTVGASADSEPRKQSPEAEKVEYKDNPLDKLFITLFSRKMSEQLGGKAYDGSYEAFVELSKEISRGRSTDAQQEVVARVLKSLLPPDAPTAFRKLFPFNKMTAEFNAWITTIFFKWLVGPSELKEVEVEFEGEKQRWNSGVLIKKCRYLDSSQCVGMCVNMCKLPTQSFFTDDFGLPLTMNPNFEDFSCEMIYGQAAPPLPEDPIYNQPCLVRVCGIGGTAYDTPCPKLDSNRLPAAKTVPVPAVPAE